MSKTQSVLTTDKLYNCVNILRDPKLVRQFQIYFGVPNDQQYPDYDYCSVDNKDESVIPSAEDNDHCLKKQPTEEIRNRKTGDGSIQSDINGTPASTVSPVMGEIEESVIPADTWTIPAKLFYHLFKFGSALGDDVFYFVFFSIWSWHLDLIVLRKLSLVWGIVLYVGQLTKDLVKWPRPHSPPVVILERRFQMEYGMPSTHTMIGLAIPTCMVLLTNSRYDHFFSDVFPLWAQASLWIGWTSLVSLSRIYVGMHSVLDVLVGLCYAAVLMVLVFPWVDTIDSLIIHTGVSPIVVFIIYYSSIHWYPCLESWSSTLGDTSATVSISSGIFISGWLNNYLGLFPDSVVDDYFFGEFSIEGLGGELLRYCVGLIMVTPVYFGMKMLLKKSLCAWYGHPVNKTSMKFREIEIPYVFFTFFVLTLFVSTLCPIIFRSLNI